MSGAAECECHRGIDSQRDTLPILRCTARDVFGMRGVVFEQTKVMGQYPMTSSEIFYTKKAGEQVGNGSCYETKHRYTFLAAQYSRQDLQP